MTRQLANSVLDDPTAAKIKGLLEKKHSEFKETDDSWPIDRYFFTAMSGKRGHEIAVQKVLAMFPDAERWRSRSAVQQEVDLFVQKSDLLKFCPKETQDQIGDVLDMLKCMHRGEAPTFAQGAAPTNL